MRAFFSVATIAALLLVSSSIDAPTPQRLGVPWLRGFPVAAFTDQASAGAEAQLREQLPGDADPDCTTTSQAAFALVADVSPGPGIETVLASYTAGIVVLDARGHRIASAPPFACQGSVDAIESIAAGDLRLGSPVLAFTATAGGRVEHTTWLFLFVVRGDQLAPIFIAPVEEWRGSAVSAGEVVLRPGRALVYRAPNGEVSTWAYDRGAGRFVVRRSPRPPAPEMLGPAV